jgi:ribosome-associated protein
VKKECIIKEIKFKAIRSSGPGGQHVNKVSTKIVLSFELEHSACLTEEEKTWLKKTLTARLTQESVLLISCDESRSQAKNKEIAVSRFVEMIEKGLQKAKKRKPTKPSKAAIKKRKESKAKLSKKKALRKKPEKE